MKNKLFLGCGRCSVFIKMYRKGFVIKLLGCVKLVIEVYVNIGFVIGYVVVLLFGVFVCRYMMLIGFRVYNFKLIFLNFWYLDFEFVLRGIY